MVSREGDDSSTARSKNTVFPQRKNNSKCFQEPADLIRDSNSELNQFFPAGQNESLLMAFKVFDMYRLLPSRKNQPGDTTSIILLGFIQLHRQSGMDVPGVDTINVQAKTLE